MKQAVGGRPPRYAPAQACNRSAQRQPWARPAEPDQPICTIQPAGRTCCPDVCNRRQTDRHQTASSLNPPGRGHNKVIFISAIKYTCWFIYTVTSKNRRHCNIFGICWLIITIFYHYNTLKCKSRTRVIHDLCTYVKFSFFQADFILIPPLSLCQARDLFCHVLHPATTSLINITSQSVLTTLV